MFFAGHKENVSFGVIKTAPSIPFLRYYGLTKRAASQHLLPSHISKLFLIFCSYYIMPQEFVHRQAVNNF